MPVATYETMFLLDPNKVSADAEGTKQQIHHILERHGATIVVSRPWDYNHKLSYPIGKQKKGAFHIIYYTMESTKQAELERDFALQEGLILRQLTLKLDPKWQEAILQVAREDTRTASPSAACRTRPPCRPTRPRSAARAMPMDGTATVARRYARADPRARAARRDAVAARWPRSRSE